MDKEKIAHDLAVIVVENILEDIDDDYNLKEYSKEAVAVYRKAKENILKELEKTEDWTMFNPLFTFQIQLPGKPEA